MDPIDNVEQVAENMQLYPLEHYLTGRSLLLSFDAQVTQLILSTSAFSFSSFYRPPPPPTPHPGFVTYLGHRAKELSSDSGVVSSHCVLHVR